MYIGNQPYQVAFLTDQFSGNGSTTAFTMSVAPANTSSVLVVVSGVVQDPSTYSVSGTTLTFSQVPPTGTGNISARYLGIPASNVTTTAYRTVTNFTATSGQTTFTPPSYTAGFINVYRNGVYLPTTDYTASNGTTVVLNNGCTTGDTVTVESFLVSSVLNALPQTGGVISGNLTITGIETVGSGSPLGGTTNPIIASVSSSNNYIQTYIYNSTNGSSSSADLVAYPNNGADAHGWVDMGITSQTYADTTYTVTGPNESYLFGSAPSGSSTTGNLVIATDNTGTANSIQFYTNGFTQAKSAAKMVIDGATGNVGIGTATPSSKLHTLASSSNFLTVESSSNLASLQLKSATGTATYFISYSAGTETSRITTDNTGIIAFSNTASATERMRIDSSGRMLWNTTSAPTNFGLFRAVYGSADWTFGPQSSGLSFLVQRPSDNVGVYLTAGGTSWSSSSDETLKDIIEPITNGVEKVVSLRSVIGKFKTDNEGMRRAFLIAQDVQKVLPEAVNTDSNGTLGLNYQDLIPLLVASIQELKAINDTQAQAITSLTKRITALEAK